MEPAQLTSQPAPDVQASSVENPSSRSRRESTSSTMYQIAILAAAALLIFSAALL